MLRSCLLQFAMHRKPSKDATRRLLVRRNNRQDNTAEKRSRLTLNLSLRLPSAHAED